MADDAPLAASDPAQVSAAGNPPISNLLYLAVAVVVVAALYFARGVLVSAARTAS